MLAFYGALTVLGPALHSLPGVDHVKYGAVAGDPSDDPTSPHDDCPVCLLLAQGQIAEDWAPVVRVDVTRVQPVEPIPITFPAPIGRPSAPRAPPSA